MTDDNTPAKPRNKAPNKSHGRKTISATFTPRELVEHQPHLKGAWVAKIITLFPDAFPGVLGESLTGRALKEGLWRIETTDLRRFGEGKHRNVDDTPAGGGAGMVLRADILGAAIEHTQKKIPKGDRKKHPLIYLSPRGKPFTQAMAQEWSQADGITMICGRFEGIDERIIDYYDVQEVSLGDFVLTGGEIAAQALIDATVRLIPRVLGNHASTEDESFSHGLLEHPQYTKPSVWNALEIPEILLSGHHGKVADWRKAMAERLTKERRPDLWRVYCETHNIKPDEDAEQ